MNAFHHRGLGIGLRGRSSWGQRSSRRRALLLMPTPGAGEALRENPFASITLIQEPVASTPSARTRFVKKKKRLILEGPVISTSDYKRGFIVL